LKYFWDIHPESKLSLLRWQAIASQSEWTNFLELRKTFNSADYYKGKVIFDIAGNHYRLIAVVNFIEGWININQVLTHGEYDKNKWKEKYD
jgi:mRNA interferase HigB